MRGQVDSIDTYKLSHCLCHIVGLLILYDIMLLIRKIFYKTLDSSSGKQMD